MWVLEAPRERKRGAALMRRGEDAHLLYFLRLECSLSTSLDPCVKLGLPLFNAWAVYDVALTSLF